MKKNNVGKLLGVALVVAIICTGLFYMLFAMKANSQSGISMVVAAKALKAGTVVGCGTLVCDPHSWSPHVGGLRMVVSKDVRGQGVGRALSQETFALALGSGLERLTVQMTVDQQAAIALFESLGFKAEALLRDHVRDVEGKKHDIVVLGHNVAQVRAQMEAYGLPGAVQH